MGLYYIILHTHMDAYSFWYESIYVGKSFDYD